jgi:hypothetical protein
VDPVGVGVVDVFAEATLQVLLVQDDDAIQQLPAGATDPSPGDSVLPGALKGCAPRLDTQMVDHGSVGDRSMISRRTDRENEQAFAKDAKVVELFPSAPINLNYCR